MKPGSATRCKIYIFEPLKISFPIEEKFNKIQLSRNNVKHNKKA